MYTTHFIGATGEAGDPDEFINPPAPSASRAAGDPFVHYLEDSNTDQTLVRFWFQEKPSSRLMAVDFEVLVPVACWLGDEPLALTPSVVIKLISMVYFQEYADDYYKEHVDILSFHELGTSRYVEVPYPEAPVSKYEIAAHVTE